MGLLEKKKKPVHSSHQSHSCCTGLLDCWSAGNGKDDNSILFSGTRKHHQGIRPSFLMGINPYGRGFWEWELNKTGKTTSLLPGELPWLSSKAVGEEDKLPGFLQGRSQGRAYRNRLYPVRAAGKKEKRSSMPFGGSFRNTGLTAERKEYNIGKACISGNGAAARDSVNDEEEKHGDDAVLAGDVSFWRLLCGADA